MNTTAQHNYGRLDARQSKIILSFKTTMKVTFDDSIWYYCNKMETKSSTHFFVQYVRENSKVSNIPVLPHSYMSMPCRNMKSNT